MGGDERWGRGRGRREGGIQIIFEKGKRRGVWMCVCLLFPNHTPEKEIREREREREREGE